MRAICESRFLCFSAQLFVRAAMMVIFGELRSRCVLCGVCAAECQCVKIYYFNAMMREF